jgi:hypothetical protein
VRIATKEPGAAALVALVALLLWAPTTRFGLDIPAPYDEGNTVVAAWRVLEGDLLYRDVWQMHAPGTAYLLAAAFRLFGTTLVVERVLKLLLLVSSGVLLHRLARRVAGLELATGAALLFVLHTAHYPFLRPNDPAFLLGLAALLLSLSCLERSPRFMLLAGLAAGLGAAFRHDFGLYTGTAIALLLLARHDAPRLTRFAMGAGLALVPLVLALRVQGTLDDAAAQAIVFPATAYAEARRLPIFDVPAFAIPLAVLLTAVAVAWRRRQDALLLVALAGLAFYGYARVRPDAEHLLPASAFALVAGAGVLQRWPHRALARLVAFAVFAALAMPALALRVARVRAALEASATPGTPPAAGGFLAFPPDLLEAVRFLDARVSAGSPVFAGNDRHDRIMLNHALLYFLAERPGVSRYYNLHPGLATTREVQGEIAACLDRTPALVRWRAPLWDEPNGSGRSSGVTGLDDAIRRRYRQVASWGAFSGWERRP